MTRHARHRMSSTSTETRALFEQNLRRQLGLGAAAPGHDDDVAFVGGADEPTVEIAAHYLYDILGLGEHLQGQQPRRFDLRTHRARQATRSP